MNVDGLTESKTDNTKVIEDSTETIIEDKKPIVQSRWVAKSNVARYDKRTLDTFSEMREPDGWHRGAKVHRVKSQ